MRRFNFCCKWLVAAAVPIVCASCGDTTGPAEEILHFAVLDVGQGLAQLGVSGETAIAWDMGPASGFEGWRDGYRTLDSPHLTAIVLSHSDEDHRGGLLMLDSSLSFDGLVVTSPFEDTALIRRESGAWKDRLRFAQKARGDTIGGLDGVMVRCLWPPQEISEEIPLADEYKNRYSLCFRLSYGGTSVFISSDIDSSALAELSRNDGFTLKSDALIVPHHGSRTSIHSGFYGFVLPQLAVVSFGRDNPYGHPSGDLFDLCFRMQIELRTTAGDGHVMGKSNGYYWIWESIN